jgi:hypothetical protein
MVKTLCACTKSVVWSWWRRKYKYIPRGQEYKAALIATDYSTFFTFRASQRISGRFPYSPFYGSAGGEASAMKSNEIQITGTGSLISKHPDGVVCTYDGRHRILKVPMEDGSIFEVLQE